MNGDDLAEVQGGEVATTNLHSSHGPNFILQLRFSINQDPSSMLDKSKCNSYNYYKNEMMLIHFRIIC